METKRASFQELLYQYTLKKMEAEVYIEKFQTYLQSTQIEMKIPQFIRDSSKAYAKAQLSFFEKRKSIIEFNIKSLENELKEI